MCFRLVGIGEVLWDLLPDGPQLGGAPANFAYHTRSLGARAALVTRLGNDDLGRAILSRFERMDIPLDTVQVDEVAPTGTVTIAVSADGVPSYTIHENVAWDRLLVTEPALEALRAADAVCFGSLGQRGQPARSSIQRLVAATPAHALRVFDVNLRQDYFSRAVLEQSLVLANVLKLNDQELPVLAEIFGLDGSTRDQIAALAEMFDLRLVALTRGPAGSLLFESGEWSDCSRVETLVVDTIGAGDAFAAALVVGMLRKYKLPDINALANEVARHVCAHAGATPPLPRKLVARFGAGRLPAAPCPGGRKQEPLVGADSSTPSS